jgi:toxin ParE1/3/4
VKVKPVVPREQTNRDIDEATEYYLNEGAARAAVGFIDTLERAYGHIGRHEGVVGIAPD